MHLVFWRTIAVQSVWTMVFWRINSLLFVNSLSYSCIPEPIPRKTPMVDATAMIAFYKEDLHVLKSTMNSILAATQHFQVSHRISVMTQLYSM
jgi:hypothetical protein